MLIVTLAGNEAATLLRRLISYDPETGIMTWKTRTPDLFTPTGERSAKGCCAQWNTRYAGKPALAAVCAYGYLYGNFLNTKIKAHRAAFCIVHGEWPDRIDHINGDRQDNRIVNLRSVSTAENNRNLKLNKHNKSGVAGVFWDQDRNKWMVRCGDKSIGRFSEFSAAIAARKSAEVAMNFHSNHGR